MAEPASEANLEYIIKKPLLAGTLDDLDKLTFPTLATPKIDGIRALRLGNDLISRQYKQIRNVKIREILSKLLPEGSDGEIITAGTFQDVSSSVMKSGGTENFEKPFTFYWFDYVKDDPKKPYEKRMLDMKEYIEENPDVLLHAQGKIIPLFPSSLTSIEGVAKYEETALADGFEGVMLRSPKGPYKMGRSTLREGTLLKLKKFSDAEAIVIDTQELFHNTNEKVRSENGENKRSQKKEGKVAGGKLGALVVQTDDGVRFNIGSGFTDEQRHEFWKGREALVGQFAKFKYFEVGSKDAPRFPTFLGFRSEEDM